MWTKLRILALGAGLLVVNAQVALRTGEFAIPIKVALEGFTDSEVNGARLRVMSLGANEVAPPVRPGYWECPPRCTVHLVVVFREPLPGHSGVVRIEIGERVFTMPLSEMEADGESYSLPNHVAYGPHPPFALCRNWPGMQTYVQYVLLHSLPGFLTLCVLGWIVSTGMSAPWRDRFAKVVGFQVAPSTQSSSRGWNLVGWAGLIGGFAFLEWMQPYYFTQDDALAGELPGILLGCRSLWDGMFPDWNPYVFLGAPLAAIGFWAITYPPQLISYAIARHFLGDEFATMEVFAALHLAVGFVAMRHLSRRVGMGGMSANIAALSFVFAGAILIMGRSWHAFIANAVWLPLLGIAIQRFREGPVGPKWVLGVGLILGLSYHAGFPQIVAMLGMFLVAGLLTVALAERFPPARLLPAAAAIMLGIGIAMPLLLHHLQMTGGGIQRFVPLENGVYDKLLATALPYPLVEASLPTIWGSTDVEKMGHFYFFGGIFALLFAVQMTAFWLCWPDRSAWSRSWWIPSGMFAFLMVLGEPALLWKGLASLPLSSFFLRYSFRFFPWLAFCAILGGGLMLDRVLAQLKDRRRVELVVGVTLCGILVYHLAMCRPSFYSYGFQPYPDLPAEFESTFHPYGDMASIQDKNSKRIASWHQVRSPSPDFFASLPLNLPHYYRVPSILGYDPVTEGQPRVTRMYERFMKDPATACKAYGVGWHLFNFSDKPTFSPNLRFQTLENAVLFEPAYRGLLKADMATIAKAHGTTLKELKGVDPLAFDTARPQRALPMTVHCRGVDVDVSCLTSGAEVTINFLSQPYMTLTLDGTELELKPDSWERITTTLPTAGKTLSLRYAPPWGKTCAIGAVICLFALALTWATTWLASSAHRATCEH